MKKSQIDFLLGKHDYFYVGAVVAIAISVTLTVTLVGLASGQMRWGWSNFFGPILGLSLLATLLSCFGPYAVFQWCDRDTRLVDAARRPGHLAYFAAGAIYILVLGLYLSIGVFISIQFLMFPFMLSSLALTVVLPLLFLKSVAKRLQRNACPPQQSVPPVLKN